MKRRGKLNDKKDTLSGKSLDYAINKFMSFFIISN